MKILTIFTDGVEELELIAPVDLCRRAGIEVVMCGLDKTYATSSHNITISNLLKFENINLDEFDALFIPGGPHYKIMESNEKVLETIKYFYENNKYLIGICAAPTIFGHLGLLKNKNYTCFTSMDEDFGGTYIDEHVVVDLPFITAKSAASAIGLGYSIVGNLLSNESLKKLKKSVFD